MDDDEILEDNSKSFTIDSPEATDLLVDYINFSKYNRQTKKLIEAYRNQAKKTSEAIRKNNLYLSMAKAAFAELSRIRRASYYSDKKKKMTLPANKRHLSVQLSSAINKCNSMRETIETFENTINELNETLDNFCSSLNANLALSIYYEEKINDIKYRLKNSNMDISSYYRNHEDDSMQEHYWLVPENVLHESNHVDLYIPEDFSPRRK